LEGTATAGIPEGPKRGHRAFVNADIYQAAILNKILPAGFKIEVLEIVQRNYEQRVQQQRRAKQQME
jgi:hypothetical protein